MNLLGVGCNYHKTGVELRERLAFDGDKLPRALDAICSRRYRFPAKKANGDWRASRGKRLPA